MKKLLSISCVLVFVMACGPAENEHPCEASEFCVYDMENKSSDCAEGYQWAVSYTHLTLPTKA